MSSGAWALRPGRETDRAFVGDSWLRSDARSPAARDEGPGYMRNQKRRIRAILARAELIVAASAEDEDAILGWAVLTRAPAVVYYAFVRNDARRLGIARAMLGALDTGGPVEYTHRPVTRGVAAPSGWRYAREWNYLQLVATGSEQILKGPEQCP